MRCSKLLASLALWSLAVSGCSELTGPVAAEPTVAPATPTVVPPTSVIETPTPAVVSEDQSAPALRGATIGLSLEPPTLDFTTSSSPAIAQVLLYNVYETLVRHESDGTVSPLLAESWTTSDDGLIYTFSLRKDAMFHDGVTLHADDVVYSLNHVMTSDRHPLTSTFDAVAEIRALDDATVELTLSRPNANILFFLGHVQGIIRAERASADLETDAIGTGPFTLGEWVHGESIIIDASATYWGSPANLSSVTFRYLADPMTLTDALLSGDIDVIGDLSDPSALGPFVGDDRFSIYAAPSHGEVTLAINGRRPPLDNVLVRRAISHAIDRQSVIDAASAGYGEPIGSFSTPLDPWHQDLTSVYPYDPDRARDLLAEAGVGDLVVELALPPPGYARLAGQVVQQQLADVGITANITEVSWDVWLTEVFRAQNYDLSITAHIEPLDLVQYGNPDYYWGNDSPAATPLLLAADVAPNLEQRNEIYRQVLQGITAQAADHWLFVLPNLAVIRTGVTGYTGTVAGALDVTALALDS